MMTKLGTIWRRSFVLAASVALLAVAAPTATLAQDEGDSVDILTYFSGRPWREGVGSTSC